MCASFPAWISHFIIFLPLRHHGTNGEDNWKIEGIPVDLGERIVKNGPKMRDYVSIGEHLVLTIVFRRAIGVMCQTFKREAGEAVLRFPGSSILNQVMVAQRLGKWRGRQNQQTWFINRLNIVLQHVTTCYQKRTPAVVPSLVMPGLALLSCFKRAPLWIQSFKVQLLLAYIIYRSSCQASEPKFTLF